MKVRLQVEFYEIDREIAAAVEGAEPGTLATAAQLRRFVRRETFRALRVAEPRVRAARERHWAAGGGSLLD